MKNIFQISMKSLLVEENGILDEDISNNYLSASMVYPTEGIPSVESIRKVKLEDKKEFFFSDLQFPERILFKQTVHGDSFIEIKISKRTKIEKINGILKVALEAGIIAGVGLITGGAGVAIITAVTKSVTESLFDLENKEDEKLELIGQGFAYLPSNFDKDQIEVRLSTPERVKIGRKREYENGETIDRDFYLKKGVINGKIILDVKKLTPKIIA